LKLTVIDGKAANAICANRWQIRKGQDDDKEKAAKKSMFRLNSEKLVFWLICQKTVDPEQRTTATQLVEYFGKMQNLLE
jgi:hypothetical protein